MISIIVPSYNSEKTIEKNIKSLLNQNYKKKYEIIVVDSSTDETPQIVSKFPVKLIKQRHVGPAAARNLGVKKAKGKTIVFIDSDCIAPKNWLRNLLKPLSDKNFVAVAGTYKTKNKESMIARFTGYEIEQRHEKMKKFDSINFVGTFNCVYRKRIFLKFGGFNVKFVQAEDPELSFRIAESGYKIKFQPSAYVYHFHPSSLIKYLKQKFWRAFWKVSLYSQHKRKFLEDTYTPRTLFYQVLFTGLFILLFFIGLFFTEFLSLAIISIFLIYIFNLSLLKFLWKKEKKIIFSTCLVIFLRNLVALVGISIGILNLFKNKIFL